MIDVHCTDSPSGRHSIRMGIETGHAGEGSARWRAMCWHCSVEIDTAFELECLINAAMILTADEATQAALMCDAFVQDNGMTDARMEALEAVVLYARRRGEEANDDDRPGHAQDH